MGGEFALSVSRLQHSVQRRETGRSRVLIGRGFSSGFTSSCVGASRAAGPERA